jgi:hypothetical protein
MYSFEAVLEEDYIEEKLRKNQIYAQYIKAKNYVLQ